MHGAHGGRALRTADGPAEGAQEGAQGGAAYRWVQGLNEICISLAVPKGTRGKELHVSFETGRWVEWDYCGIAVGLRWDCGGIAVGLLWDCYVIVVGLLWDCCGLLWGCCGIAM